MVEPIGLEKGKFGKVRFESRSLLPVEEYAKANEAARKANKLGEQAGASFGTLRKEEEAALKLWREYVLKKQTAGTPARPLDEILREAIEREETKDETPLFSDVADEFLSYKEKSGAWKGGDSYDIAASRLKRLQRVLTDKNGNPLTLAEITPAVLETAIPAAIERKKNGVPAPQ